MKRGVCFFDALFVLLNISSPYTLIPCLLFTRHTGVNSAIIFILTFIYIIIRFKNRIKFTIDSLFVIFLLISLYNLANSAIQGTLAVGFLGIFFANCVFYLLLYNIYIDYRNELSVDEALTRTTKGYVWLCFYQLFIVAILFFVIRAHVINLRINEVTWNYDIFADNASRVYTPTRYFLPYHISILSLDDMDRLPFLNLEGLSPLGMFHEPHTMTYYIVPFLFLMHYMFKKNWLFLLDLLFVIYILVAASTTNLLCTLAVLLLWSVLKEKKLIVVYLLLASTVIGLLQTIDSPIVELVRFKLESGSMEYSASTLDFAFTPKTLFGTDFYDLSYLEKGLNNYDVGYFVFILNIVFILILGYKTFRLCMSKDKLAMCVGLFSAYFMLHSAKLALRTYSLEMLIFIMFVVTICYNEKIKKHGRIPNKRPLEKSLS